MRALVLSGGAARGAYDAGVASALLEHEHFDIICGTSIGAVNAACIAQDDPQLLAQIWATIGARGIVRPHPTLAAIATIRTGLAQALHGPPAARLRGLLDVVWAIPGLSRLRRLPHLLGLLDSTRILAAIDDGLSYAELKRTLIVGVTNLCAGTSESFAYIPVNATFDAAAALRRWHARPITAANYGRAIAASIALPPAFEPVEIQCEDGAVRSFCDGTYSNNTPIRQAINAGADEVTVVFTQHFESALREHQIRSLAQIAAIVNDTTTERLLELELRLVRSINDAVRRGAAPDKRFIDLRVIGPSVPLKLPGFNFHDQLAIDRVFAQGRVDGTAAAMRDQSTAV